MTVKVSALALEVLRALDGFGGDRDSVALESSIRTYLNDRDRQRQGWQYPGFMRGLEPGDRVSVELSVDAELWEALEREAATQDVAPELLLDQAAFYLAAELERGEAIGRALDDERPDRPGQDAA